MAYTTDPGLSNVLNTGHGLRDELADPISIVSPTDVPLLSNLNRIPVGNTYFEWMMDTISKPSATSTTAEGAEAEPAGHVGAHASDSDESNFLRHNVFVVKCEFWSKGKVNPVAAQLFLSGLVCGRRHEEAEFCENCMAFSA